MFASLVHRSRKPEHVFVSYRSTQRELATRLSEVARASGKVVDTIETDLVCPFPEGWAEGGKWLTDQFAERVVWGCTFIMVASADARSSPWILWESLEGITKARRVVICWVSGKDPFEVLFPLPRFMYRIMRAPQSFIVDARTDSAVAVTAIQHILAPALRYRASLRFVQATSIMVCLALLLSPVTILAISSLLDPGLAGTLRSALLRPWVVLTCLLLALVFTAISYPPYGGPLWLAPSRTDKYVRLINPGRAGARWNKMLTATGFILACVFDGVDLVHIRSMSVIQPRTYIIGAMIAVLLTLGYERVRWNVFSHHVGAIYRKLKKLHGIEDAV